MNKRCKCPHEIIEGHPVPLSWPEPACPIHGLPEDRWYAGDPLRRHARYIERATGEAITAQEAHDRCESRREFSPGVFAVDCVEHSRRFRLETPTETTRRLMLVSEDNSETDA